MSSVYIHVPFCRSKCAYCDFFSVIRLDTATIYADAVATEFELRSEEIPMPIRTLYIGGGTPSALDPVLLSKMTKPMPLGEVMEFTIEVNPDDVTLQKATAWKEIGANRISMGVQSFVDDELKAVGRRHSADGARKAFQTLRDAGFDNISLDLIYGLPGQTDASWQYSLDALVELHPEHFSAYLLSYEPRTRLSALLKAGKIAEATDDEVERRYANLCTTAAAAGYEHYEISNFALQNRRAVHNSGYWREVPYLGLGPAAHSFDGRTRRINPASIQEYLANVGSPCIDEETDIDRFNDRLFTALRTSDGLTFPPNGGDINLSGFQREVRRLLATGLLEIKDDRLIIPKKHWLISDSIIRDLLI